MSEITHIPAPDTSRLTRFCRLTAAMIPACVIGYSALVDPLLNIGTLGDDVGGVILGAQSKSTTLTKIVMSSFLLASLAIAIWARPVIPHRLKMALIPGGMLLALACVSAAWGKAPIDTLMLAVYQSMLFATLLISVAVSADPRRIMHFMLLMLALVVAANVVAVFTLPPAANGHPGIYLFKNTTGAAAGCALLFGLFHLFKGKLVWRAMVWFTTIGAVFVTFASDSKAALALAIAAPLLVALFFLMSWALAIGPMMTLMLMVALIVSGFYVIAGMMSFDFEDVLVAIYGGTSFTGRTDIWALMHEHMPLSPWFGNGYRGFWSLAASPKHASEIVFIRTIGSGHNGYLDIRLDLGIVGLCLLVLFMALSFQTIARFGRRPTFRSMSYMAIFIFLAVRNTMESTILWSMHF
ncbi:MAG: O-antigen ligase family protein, partial [Hyphomicrobiaceae bacterium]